MSRPKARSPHKKGVRLTARDTAIFEELLHRRVDTIGGLHARHWPDCERDSARHRLARLTAWGFLMKAAIQTPPGPLVHPRDEGHAWVPVYSLTPKGVAALRRRSLAGSALQGRSVKADIAETSVLHQLVVNRVGDMLGAALTVEHLLDLAGKDRRHRPDATYLAAPDRRGAATVMLEVDLGHYSRQRILGKVRTFLAEPDAKGVLFVCPTGARAAWIARTLRAAHGDRIMDRVQVLSFEEIKEGRLMRRDLYPAPRDDDDSDPYRHLPRAA